MIMLFVLLVAAVWLGFYIFAAAALIVFGILFAVLKLIGRGSSKMAGRSAGDAAIPRIDPASRRAKKPRRGFTDEEILGMGLYPKDEAYKMSLISRILDKKGR